MNINKKLEREKSTGIFKIFISLVFIILLGYFVYDQIMKHFFEGWQVLFVIACYFMVLVVLVLVDIGTLRWISYNMFIDDDKLKIRDGLFSRAILIPLDRLYYVSTIAPEKGVKYDTLFITDKKTRHRKVKKLDKNEFTGKMGHLNVIEELEDTYPGRTFYCYRVYHHGYRFSYFLYMVYKNCERCKLSEISMDLVRKLTEEN